MDALAVALRELLKRAVRGDKEAKKSLAKVYFTSKEEAGRTILHIYGGLEEREASILARERRILKALQGLEELVNRGHRKAEKLRSLLESCLEKHGLEIEGEEVMKAKIFEEDLLEVIEEIEILLEQEGR